MDLSAAWQAYAPVRDLLDSDYCFRHVAAGKLYCPFNLGSTRFKAQVTRGYPAVFASSCHFQVSKSGGDFQGKLTSTGLLKVSGEIKQEAPVRVCFSMERLLTLTEDWGKYNLYCRYPGTFAQITGGFSSRPSLILSLLTSDMPLRLAIDAELSLQHLELRQYHATTTWQRGRHFLAAMHQSTSSRPVLGNLYFGYCWRSSQDLTVGSQLLYQSAANTFVSTVGVAWRLGTNTLKAKLNSEGFVSLSALVPISSFALSVSTHFDARNLHSSTPREAHFGFQLRLSP